RGRLLRPRPPVAGPGAFPAPARTVRLPLVIVGGGVAGRSAAWRLDKRGFHDFVVTEMEPRAGGNARWGENEVSAYPWGAHYVPVPGRREALARRLYGDGVGGGVGEEEAGGRCAVRCRRRELKRE